MAITTNDNFQNNSPKPLDNKYGILDSGSFRSYVSVAEVNSTIPGPYRSIGLTVLVGSTEYWYMGGVGDSDLVPKGVLSTTSPLSLSAGVISISQASGSVNGYLSSSNWTTFNNKLSSVLTAASIIGDGTSGNGIQLSGDSATPGNSQYYGTNSSGTKGFFSLPSGVTSVGLTVPSAFSVAGSPITSSGVFAVTAIGTTSQYIRGDGTLATLPIPDGSETKLVEGSGTVITGTGTLGDPYIVNSTATGGTTWGSIIGTLSDQTDLQDELDAKQDLISPGTTLQYYRGDKVFATLDKTAVGLTNVDNTSDVNKPISTTTQTALNTKEPSLSPGTTLQYYRGDKSWQALDTTAVLEGSNLYFTNSRARSALSAGSGISYNSSTGIISSTISQADGSETRLTAGTNITITGSGTTVSPYIINSAGSAPVTSVFGRTGAVVSQNGDYTTSQVTEGSNLYFTNTRARSAISAGTGISYNSSTGVITASLIGSGTTNRVPKWVGSSQLGDSNIQDDGTTVTVLSNILVNNNVRIGNSPGINVPVIIGTSSGFPYEAYYYASAGTNEKIWDRYSDTTKLHHRILNDAGTSSTEWMVVTRSGTTVSLIELLSSSAKIGSLSGTGVRLVTASSDGTLSTQAIPDGSETKINAGTNITVTGSGTIGSPYVVNATAAASGLTSVGLTMPSGLTVSNSPLIANGTIAVSTTLNGFIKGNGSGFTAVSSLAISDTTNLQSSLDSKEPLITAGTTAQYYRGDKTWQTLSTTNVPEGSSLYFTTARARTSLSAGTGISYNSTTGAISSTITQADGSETIVQAGSNITVTGSGTAGSPYVITGNVVSTAWGNITGTLSNQTDLQAALNAKENSITSGTTSQYWRGDKTFQTLNTSVVPESGNLYYTDARARASISAGSGISYNSSTGLITNTAASITASNGLTLTSGDITLGGTLTGFTQILGAGFGMSLGTFGSPTGGFSINASSFTCSSSSFFINSGLSFSTTTSTTSFTVSAAIAFVFLNSSSSGQTVTLPSATSVGKVITIINRSSGGATWNVSPSLVTPNGTAVSTLATNTSYQIIANGSNWMIYN